MALLGAIVAHAAGKSAAADLDAELKRVIRASPPPELKVLVGPPEDPNLTLIELELRLDGKRLPTPPTDLLNPDFEPVEAWKGVLGGGRHRLLVKMTYQGLQTYGRKYSVTIGSTMKFEARNGLAIDVLPVLEVDPSKDWKHRFSLKLDVTPRMTAKVDDGSMPPRLVGTAPPPASVLDAVTSPVPDEVVAPPATEVAVDDPQRSDRVPRSRRPRTRSFARASADTPSTRTPAPLEAAPLEAAPPAPTQPPERAPESSKSLTAAPVAQEPGNRGVVLAVGIVAILVVVFVFGFAYLRSR